MPTLIILDNSLSMNKNFDTNAKITPRDIAVKIIHKIIEHFSINEKFEHVALIAVSSSPHVVCEFTREYDKLLKSLSDLKVGDYPSLEEAFNLASNIVIEEWACFTNIQVIFITDNSDTLHSSSVKNLCFRLKENKSLLKDYYLSQGIDFDEKIHINPLLNEDITKSIFYTNYINSNKTPYLKWKFPFAFPNKFDIICLNSEKDFSNNNFEIYGFDDSQFIMKKYIDNIYGKIFYLNQLIELNNSSGKLYLANNLTNLTNIENVFARKIVNDLYGHFKCKLKFGHLESNVTLAPAPLPFKGYQNYSYVEKEMSRNLDIFAFVNINELTIAPIVTRHLVLPDELFEIEKEQNKETEPEMKTSEDDSSNGSFAYLLHASLKVENAAAIVSIGDEWYGAVHCMLDAKNDPKKKLNLVLSIFAPGNDVLHSMVNKATNSNQSASQSSNRSQPNKSYSKNCAIWYRQNNLVSDLQKIMRNAKKMQEKMPLFYKELNKVRKAALSFGFYELFDGLVLMLEKELTNIAANANAGGNINPDTIYQIGHCINCLRSDEYKDYRKDIVPLTIPR